MKGKGEKGYGEGEGKWTGWAVLKTP